MKLSSHAAGEPDAGAYTRWGEVLQVDDGARRRDWGPSLRRSQSSSGFIIDHHAPAGCVYTAAGGASSSCSHIRTCGSSWTTSLILSMISVRPGSFSQLSQAAMLDHIDYAARKFGVDHLSIGTDRAYVSSSEKSERARLPERRRGRTDFNWFWPRGRPFSTPEWNKEHQHLSMSWTNWPLFTVGLVQRGYADEDIRKIIGGNFLRVAREVPP